MIVDPGDDGLNIRGIDFYPPSVDVAEGAVVMGLTSDSSTNRNYELELFEPGDLVFFADEQQNPVALLRVANREVISNTVSKIYFQAQGGEDLATVMQKIAAGMRGFNLGKSSQRYLIRNNYFGNNAGRGMIISAPNGVISNNQIVGPRMSAMLLATFNGSFYDGPGAVNVKVTGNAIRHTNNSGGVRNAPAGAISIFAEELKEAVSFPRMQDILMEYNLIKEFKGLQVQVLHSRKVK